MATTKTHKVIASETFAERRRRVWAENLNACLDLHGWTPKRFHRELTAAGVEVSKQALYRWLSGATSPAIDHQIVIAKVLRTTHHLLFPAEIGDAA